MSFVIATVAMIASASGTVTPLALSRARLSPTWSQMASGNETDRKRSRAAISLTRWPGSRAPDNASARDAANGCIVLQDYVEYAVVVRAKQIDHDARIEQDH